MLDNFLAESKLYKFEPFLKKLVSGELIYFASLLDLIILPPNATVSPGMLFIGKIILELNLSTNFPVLSFL